MSARCPEQMAKNGGSILLSTKWARNVLKSLDWVKRRGTTAKREMNPALYELTFSWKRKIAQTVLDHNVKSLPLFVCISISGEFLPIHLIYGGVSDRCHLKVKFPDSFHGTYSINHWSNESLVIKYFHRIIFPFLAAKRQKLNFKDDAKASSRVKQPVL